MLSKKFRLLSLWFFFLVGFLFIYSEAYQNIKFDYIKEILLAFMGASVTILITALLLNQQADSEELKDSHSEIFRKKFEVYEEFFKNIIDVYEAQNKDDENLRKLEASYYKVLLFTQDHSSLAILHKAIQSCLEDNSRKEIGLVIKIFRKELGIHDNRRNTDAFYEKIQNDMPTFTSKLE